ncbi:hypothetical protein DSO57_1014353 [Entomophthora muscae]|uniref:Uncharacterized protein n=1 Tax=Entomophthora muscae TaxID=34485 RepID=A0ACC2U3S1_9FUNG|nr:hypothetical protein DSO57_1014353 [Entomophthora muscae]
MSVTNVKTSAAIKQIHTTTMQKSATTKLLLNANLKTLVAIEQMPTAKAQVPTVVNATIHHVSILPLLGYFEDKSLYFAFAL